MATFQNVSGEPVDIPSLNIRVPIDGFFDVDDSDADGLDTNPAFASTTPAAAVIPSEPVPPAVPADPEPTDTTDTTIADASAPADTEGAN